jgi:hypothetical protein
MPNGNDCLSVGIDYEQWMTMTDDERKAHTFYSLRYLVNESRKNKFIERLITFIGSLTGSIVVMAPVLWWAVNNIPSK